jgi:hypothetical protein
MSLVQVFESTNPVQFSAKFTTPVVFPKRARVTLVKAHCPRLKQLTITTGVNDTLGVQFHDEQPDTGSPRFYALTIPAGTYTPEALCTTINAQFIALKETWIATPPYNGQFAEAQLRFSWDGSHFVLRASCDSIFLDFWAEFNSSLPNESWGFNVQAAAAIVGQTGPVVLNIAHAGRSIACSTWQDTVGRLSSWNTLWHVTKPLRRRYWDAYPNPTYAPYYQHPFSGGKWTNSIAGGAATHVSSYWVGFSRQATAAGITVSGVTNGSIDSIVQTTGIDHLVLVCSETTGTLTKGKCYVFERSTATGALIRQTSDASAALQPDIQTGDQICIVVPENSDGRQNHVDYFVKPVAETSWDGPLMYQIAVDINRDVLTVPEDGEQLYLCGGFYSDINGVAGQQHIGHEWGFDPNTAFQSTTLGGGFFNEFGQRAQVYLADTDNRGGTEGVEGSIGAGNPPASITTTLGVTMGFTQPADDLLFQSGGRTPLDSTLRAATAAATAVPTDTRPLVNVQIENLPIVSSAPAFEGATTIAAPTTQHGFTRTIASIPRFGGTGLSFLNEGEDEVLSYSDNMQVIKLRNPEPMQLTQLDFTMRNCDGTLPTDLGTPFVAVLHVDGTEGEDIV